MQSFYHDLIFVGGGLASGLAATLLRRERPETRLLLLEAGRSPAWDQTWSFQVLGCDSSRTGVFRNPRTSWLAPFISAFWDSYEVRFPQYSRILSSPYVSIRYSQFVSGLRDILGSSYQTGKRVSELSPTSVRLDDGTLYEAPAVIDARGWDSLSASQVSGYQKFLGLQLQTQRKHGLRRPLIMDARLPQEDGFRFMYVLPWDETSLLIEDTHYSRGPEIDAAYYRAEILRYAAEQGFGPVRVLGEEQGSLPLPSYSEEVFPPPLLPELGVRGRFFHPTTGYSIYEAVQVAEWLAEQKSWEAEPLRRGLARLSEARWKDLEFFRRLNNMLFFAASDRERYKVLEKFYAHREDLVERFYAGQTRKRDMLRILSGRPPVPVNKGIYHFFHKVGVSYGSP